MKQIKVGSDFSGIGAFNQALNRLGVSYKELFACDMDKYARQTFILNYGEPEYYPKNVYERIIPNEALDIYMTSPPCQAFSLAGKRLGKEDKRGILFFNSYEFIQNNNPRYFIFENVKGLLLDDNGNTFNEWVNMLGGKSINGNATLFPYKESVPYHIYWKVLNAKDYGVPQNRERVFIIGIRDDIDNNFNWPTKQILNIKLKDILEDEVDETYYLNKIKIDSILNWNSINLSVPNSETRRGRVVKKIAQTLDTGCNQGIISYTRDKKGKITNYHKNDISNTLHTNSSSNGNTSQYLLDGYKIRKLTPRECFRLMDFPDTFKWNVSDSQAYKQAGNSIVVNVLYNIIKNLNL